MPKGEEPQTTDPLHPPAPEQIEEWKVLATATRDFIREGAPGMSTDLPDGVIILAATVESLQHELTELRRARDREAAGEGMTTIEMKLADGSVFVGRGTASRPDSVAYSPSEGKDDRPTER